MSGPEFIWSNLADKERIEAVPIAERWPDRTVYEILRETASARPSAPALSFQLKGGATDRAETLDWASFAARVTQAANLFRSLGIGAGDTVAYVLPNATETALALLGGLTAGIVAPINPLMERHQIAAILRETGAKAVVTLAPFPKTDIAQKVHAAVAEAPGVETVLEIDLKRYLSAPLAWLIPLLRPKLERRHRARVLDFTAELARQPADRLAFEEPRDPARIAATFHTGGTTGHPKVARHHMGGMVYNGRIAALGLITDEDVLICPLPLFHVLAAYPVMMSVIASGAHLVLPTPAGYRGEGVMDNFWALVERYRVTFMVMVPTAASALMQRPVTSDVSSLKYALCGSAPLPVQLFHRFERATGVKILEGYGMTEATCLVSLNPPAGERKIGSVGLPIPYTDIRILQIGADGRANRECATDEVGEICIASPGVFPGYTEEHRNRALFAKPDGYLRTGDLGRKDADGYVWITGRAKDLIIRGGHNIDPALIEEALAGHPSVAFVGAIGEPDAHAGEVPCAYVELADGAEVSEADLLAHARETIAEKAAVPRRIEVLPELPKTAVGKIFKPELRRRALERVYGAALAEAGIEARVEAVEDPKLGLVAEITLEGQGAGRAEVEGALAAYVRPWRLRA